MVLYIIIVSFTIFMHIVITNCGYNPLFEKFLWLLVFIFAFTTPILLTTLTRLKTFSNSIANVIFGPF